MRIRHVLTIFLFCSIAATADSADDEKQSAKIEQIAKSRRTAIGEELKVLRNHKWAGEYYFGDGLAVNFSFSLAPNAGYLFEWHGCLGLYDRNFGNVTEKDDRITIDFTLENNPKDWTALPSEFVVVHWGPRHYLIPPNKMINFCNAVNNGDEPRVEAYGSFLLRRGDEALAVTGFPAMPKEYRDYFLPEPVEADITVVEETKSKSGEDGFISKSTLITFNKGKNDKLRVGMELRVVKPDGPFRNVEIIEVADHHSKGRLTQYKEKSDTPQIGWKLSTRAP